MLVLFGAVSCYPPVMSKSCEKQPPEVFYKKVSLKTSQNSQEKNVPGSLF